MRGRILLCALCASAMAGLLTSGVEAQAKPPVKIFRGAAFADTDAARALPEPQVDPPQKQVADAWSLETSGTQRASFEDSGYDWNSDDSEYAVDGGGDSGGCDSGGCGVGDCGTCFTPYGLAAGVEATYLKPIFDSSNGFGPDSSLTFEAAPRIWLQWQTRGAWGVRGRYWDFDAQQQIVAVGDFGDTVAAQMFDDDLELYAVDLELTRNFLVRQIECCASFGARNGRLKRRQTLQLTTFDLAGGGGDDATVVAEEVNRGLDGTGITMALGMRRPLWQSRLALVCNLRGSVLWGASEVDVKGTLAEVLPVGDGDLDLNDFQSFQMFGSNNTGMWIGELQAGGEWNTPISDSFGGGDAILRIMFEAQWWNLPGVTTTNLDIDSENELYKFVGVTAAVGFLR
jgi:hypothetical protein